MHLNRSFRRPALPVDLRPGLRQTSLGGTLRPGQGPRPGEERGGRPRLRGDPRTARCPAARRAQGSGRSARRARTGEVRAAAVHPTG